MICGALQTLNEEACEDVLEETEEIHPDNDNNDVPITFIVPPSPELQQGELRKKSIDYSILKAKTSSSNSTNDVSIIIE